MNISYKICQDSFLGAPIPRGICEAELRTVWNVPRKQDASAGAVGKAMGGPTGGGPPVFVLHGQVKVPDDDSSKGIDVSYKANHYRILLRPGKNRDFSWRAYKIVALPPMLYFDAASREMATQIRRTQLLADTVADQVSARDQDSAPGQDGGGDGQDGAGEGHYANGPSDDYANARG
ncbi:MAG TPA: hypothetical protein VGF55_22105 [Gemmataceae bacterium]|jgi:hypothetical protein